MVAAPKHHTDTIRCEAAVIGSGPAGSVTAHTLAQGGKDVVLLEEGAYRSIQSCEPFSVREMTQKYRCGGLTAAIGKPNVVYVEGRCVGGGSEINSGLYHRTPPEILERWQKEFQVEHIAPAHLHPHFRACEEIASVCKTPGPTPLASRKLQEGAERLGWCSMEVPRLFRYDGAVNEEGVPQGTRMSMTESLIPEALAAGCRLFPETRVLRLRRSAGEWAIEGLQSGFPVKVCAKTVFVCAGAIQTPALLRRSGITKNIGDSLALHPTVKVVARFRERLNYSGLGVSVHQVKQFSPRISIGCSISSPPYLALAMLDHPEHRSEVSQRWPHMAIYYAMITGDTVGRIRTLPGTDDPLVRYQVSRLDLRDLARALRHMSELLFAAGARELYPSVSGMPRLQSAGDLSQIPAELPAARTRLMTIHLFSSCPMGEDRTRCATDSFGRLREAPGLHVNDASLLCSAPGVNPQGTIMAVARRNALAYLGRL